ncbi:MAG TPA: NRDE family protein [Thermoanaerobaculia bacterium]|jgi:uncharacterized protein with NRDE domain
MCLIAIAHRAAARFPLVIAANRDEDYARPSLPLQVWSDAPEVAGGRDALHGGSWLAVSRAGRFAAVTNLRGARTTTRSRGALVRDYVVSNVLPSDYSEFAGFHLLAGTIGGMLQYITPHVQTLLEDGIHAFSNAPEGERWPKMDLAATQLQTALSIEDPRALSDELLRFLGTSRNTNSIESEVFIAGERYGTRASTVIVASADSLWLSEQSYGARGARADSCRLELQRL